MNALRKFTSPRVGVFAMVSMLLTLVGLSLMLAVSDACATTPGFPTVPVDSTLANSMAMDVGAVVDSSEVPMDWQEVHHLPSEPGLSQDTGSAAFVYTRNADGILTDPD